MAGTPVASTKELPSAKGAPGAACDWIMSLKDDPESMWGDIEQFYKEMKPPRGKGVYQVGGEVWGKTLRRDCKLSPGDGIAFYHSTKARFPKGDQLDRRQRISLIGEIAKVEQRNQQVSFLTARVRSRDLEALITTPIIRNEATEPLFRAAGMNPHAVATFYRVPREIWRQLIGMIRWTPETALAASRQEPPERIQSMVMRVVRDTAQSRALKERYDYRCQVCQTRIIIGDDEFYAEVHHIRPVGGAHHGLDSFENMLVLCPNHHAMFDLGIIRFEDKTVLIGGRRHPLLLQHQLDGKNIAYHNEQFRCR
ncbi:MAG: HNH endonuclease [Acidobacteriota bacterium]|jgi:5-methylcytosine-specific restriction endonuclease McrA